MGALHDGHLTLVDAARAKADLVWVSIFVNPTQFGPNEDFGAYPRTLDQDLDACRERGVDAVFVPEVEELYPPGSQTFIEVTELSKPLCGATRPTHFRGVATIVPKLFLAAKPHVAVFGEKDYQQLAIIRRLVKDLRFDIEIVGVPTVRESDGLAKSSRNAFLDEVRRPQARVLVRALEAAEAALAAGVYGVDALSDLVLNELSKAPDAEVDYAEFRDPETLAPLRGELRSPSLLALAVFFPVSGKQGATSVRLIDNRVLQTHASSTRKL